MPYKNKADQRRNWMRLWDIKRAHISDVKRLIGRCAACGWSAMPEIMHFHHTRGRKLFTMSKFGNRSLKAIDAEIAKCDLLCPNCHTTLHYISNDTTNRKSKDFTQSL